MTLAADDTDAIRAARERIKHEATTKKRRRNNHAIL